MAKTRNKAATERDSAVREAIEYAEKHAGEDDADFVRALNLSFHELAQKRGRERGVIPKRSANAPVKSFQIYQDPRYPKTPESSRAVPWVVFVSSAVRPLSLGIYSIASPSVPTRNGVAPAP